ncbi:energy-coupling factor ABC transporter ATP-binding protein [Thalassospira marina]|uniref:Energy-coupling factor ABC transporter ATP-binding protein n=1 Tax=Thalassospira marina TaxID=2048283 RepID=A0ABN5FDC1_9PROT|nr:ABC transporter ATP-binding protein [Thalassospira marina]AUG52828.1 energy-coupling factor ABC transporter ATP-binding protein [Thalassospira marina]
MPAPDLIALRDICFSFDGSKRVLDNANFTLQPGERVALTGPNGAGKTTLFHIMMGLRKVDSGTVNILDNTCKSEQDFAAIRGRVGLLFQDSDDQLFCPTVIEDVAFGPLNLGATDADALAISHKTLADLGLDGFENRITHHLSGGEKRLVALATVLAMKPEILLLDEPTTGLDNAVETRLTAILQSLPQAMVIISHNHAFLKQVATRTVSQQNGKLVSDTPR